MILYSIWGGNYIFLQQAEIVQEREEVVERKEARCRLISCKDKREGYDQDRIFLMVVLFVQRGYCRKERDAG